MVNCDVCNDFTGRVGGLGDREIRSRNPIAKSDPADQGTCRGRIPENRRAGVSSDGHRPIAWLATLWLASGLRANRATSQGLCCRGAVRARSDAVERRKKRLHAIPPTRSEAAVNTKRCQLDQGLFCGTGRQTAE